jgi:hypothetical protein
MTFSLVELENEFLSRADDLSSLRPAIWPSEASVTYEMDGRTVTHGKCMRATYYRLTGVEPDGCRNPGLEMKGRLGKKAEQDSQERWKQMGLWVASNIKFFEPDVTLSGELDVVIKSPEDGKRIGIEHKSYYGYNANKEICGGKRPPVPGKPKIDQFLQSIIYAYEYRDKLDEYRMYYVERGDGHRVEFKIGLIAEPGDVFRPYWQQIPGPYWAFFSPDRVIQPFTLGNIYERMQKLIMLIKSQTLPPRDYTDRWDDDTVEWMYKHNRLGKTKYEAWKKGKEKPGDWQCSYCSWSEICATNKATREET